MSNPNQPIRYMKEEVKIYIHKDSQLSVVKADGTEYFINLYNGGGYYSAIFLQTQEMIDDSAKKWDEAQKEHLDAINKIAKEKEKKGWFN